MRDVLDTRGIKNIRYFIENVFRFVVNTLSFLIISDARCRGLKYGDWIKIQGINFLDFDYADENNLLSEDGYREWTKCIKDKIPKGNQWDRLLVVLFELGFTSIDKDFCCTIFIDSLSDVGTLALLS